MNAAITDTIAKVREAIALRCPKLFTECKGAIHAMLKGREFDPDKHPKDRRGRFTWSSSNNIAEGAAYDKDKEAWVDSKGKPLLKAQQARIEAVEDIHKGMVGVRLNPDPKGDCLAIAWPWIAKENRPGGKKYIYTKSHRVRHCKSKFEALKRFVKVKDRIEKQSYEDATAKGKAKPAASVAFLIDRTAMRVGGQGQTTYGATTLLAKHVQFLDNTTVRLKFKAKGGKQYDQTFKDAKLATVLRLAMQGKDGKDKKAFDRLFDVTDDTVRTYLRANSGLTKESELKSFKPHAYRYYHATVIATQIITASRQPKNEDEVAALKKRVCEAVGDFLNDEPETVFSTYINPVVWKDWGTKYGLGMPNLSSKSRSTFRDLIPSPTRGRNLIERLFDEIVLPDFGDEEKEGYLDEVPFEDADYAKVVEGAKRFDTAQRRDRLGRWTRGGGERDKPRENTQLKQAQILEDLKAYVAAWSGKPLNPDADETRKQYTDEAGNFTPERQKLHRLIKDYFLAGATPVSDPLATMMGGGPAAGKGWVSKTGGAGDLSNHVNVNPDDIKDFMPEFKDAVALQDPKLATFVHEESSDLAAEIRMEAIGQSKNILFDATGNTSFDSITGKVQAFRDSGYRVEGVYVTCPTEVALERNVNRFAESGRLVPPTYLAGVHRNVSALLPAAIAVGLFDKVKLFNTHHPDKDGNPSLVLSGRGRSFKIRDEKLWREFMSKAHVSTKTVVKGMTTAEMKDAIMAITLGRPTTTDPRQQADLKKLKAEIADIVSKGGLVLLPSDWV